MSKITQAPCKDCTERHPACHGTCEPYKEYKAYLESVRKQKDFETRMLELAIEGERNRQRKRYRK